MKYIKDISITILLLTIVLILVYEKKQRELFEQETVNIVKTLDDRIVITNKFLISTFPNEVEKYNKSLPVNSTPKQ